MAARERIPWWRIAAGACAAWGYPLVLWAIATLAGVGRAAWWADDYWHNLRDPVTGVVPRIEALARWPFWTLGVDRGFTIRPLYYQIVPALTTLLWTAPWAAHALQAITHGLVCVLLWRLLRALGAGGGLAAFGAMVFLVYPGHVEAHAWFAAWPTMLATALALWACLIVARDAKGSVPGGRRTALGVGAIVAVICCLNEQPASVVVALPMVFVTARGLRGGGHAWRRAMLMPAAGGALVVLVYLALLAWTAPTGHRGNIAGVASLGEMATRLDSFVTVLWRRMILRNFAAGAESHVLRSVVPQLRWTIGLPLMLAGVAWGVRTFALAGMRASKPSQWDRGADLARAALARPRMIVATGAAMFVAGWMPVLLSAGYEPDSRLRYWPDVGLVVLVAGAARWLVGVVLRRAVRFTRVPHAVKGLVFGTAIGLGVASLLLIRWAVMCAGFHTAMADRHALDRAQGEQLAALLGDAGGAFVVPLQIETARVGGGGIATGSPVFDAHFKGAMEFPWTATRWAQGALGRSDVEGGFWRKWSAARAPDSGAGLEGRGGDPVRGANESGLVYAGQVGPRTAREGEDRVIPWDRVAAFVVDADARVRLVTRVVIVDDRGAEVGVELPRARGHEECVVRLPRR